MSHVLTLPETAASVAVPRRGPAQPRVVLTALALLGAGVAWLGADYGFRHSLLLPLGAALGLVLFHAAFGFTSAWRVFVTAGDGRGIRAQMLMLALATLLFAPVLAAGEVFGQPVAGALAPAGLSVLVGAFIFAVGMQLGGGCSSGTLYHLGAGTPVMLVTLAGFIAGSVLATFHMTFWWELPSLGTVSLAARLGWPTAVALQLGLCGLIAAAASRVERRAGPRPDAVVAVGGWRRVVHGPWSLAAGAVLLALLNLATVLVAGHPWSITWAFALWGAKALVAVGYDLSSVPFWSGEFQQAALAAPVLADTTSVMDLGLVLGALLAAGLAGRFRPAWRLGRRRVVAAVLGGLLLGYGARIAFGCNIGAYFSGVASTSLHGWLWGLGALLGTPLGVRLRALFQLDTSPPRG